MIKSITLENYRCYQKTKVNLKKLTVIVGKNNAGKSTLIESMRLVSLALKKSQHASYKDSPVGFGLSGRIKGFKLDISKIKIDLRSIVYMYRDQFAKIKAELDDKVTVNIYIDSDIVWVVLYDSNSKNIKNRIQAKQIKKDSVSILPQIGLIKENEGMLTDETVLNDKESYLSSRHFRNEIYRGRELWSDFKELVENTWRGLSINNIEFNPDSNHLSLLVRDEGFTTEIGQMGSGVQMWLQIMWFICRTKESETIILDEPDVYMHPDLQIKLLNRLLEFNKQIIIATHSVEIISKVNPKNIMIVDKSWHKMRYACDNQLVQQVIDNLGGVTNLSLLRLSQARKCLFVEGDDIKLLEKFASIINSEMKNELDLIPTVKINGFSNSRELYGAAKLFHEETKDEIKCICILDSDYYDDEYLKEIKDDADINHLILHIWSRKEIENYLLEPSVIYKFVKDKVSFEDFIGKLSLLAENRFGDIVLDYTTQMAKTARFKGKEHKTIYKEAEKLLKSRWMTLEDKLARVPGKDFLKELNTWLKSEYGVRCTQKAILDHFDVGDISQEIKYVLKMLCESK